jgi:AraC-like DNA-binding protein
MFAVPMPLSATPVEAPRALMEQHFVEAVLRCGLTPADLQVVRARVAAIHGAGEAANPSPPAFQTFAAGWAELSGDAALGLRVAALMPEGATGIVEYVLLTAPTLRATHALYNQLGPLTGEYVRYALSDLGPLCLLALHPPEGLTLAPMLEDYRLVRLVRGLGRALRQPDFVPREVRFSHAAPRLRAPYEEAFGKGALLSFGAERAGVTFPGPLADAPLPSGDPVLHTLLLGLAQPMLEASRTPPSMTARVRERLVEGLHRGRPSLEGVAQALGMGGRTLRRRLSDEGTSFADVLDEVRKTLAQLLARQPELGEGELMRKLGFESTSALRRARRRWTER